MQSVKGSKDSGAVTYVIICCILKRKQLLAENIEGIMLQDQETVIVVVVIYRPSIYPSKYFLQNLQTVLTRECYTKLQKKYNHGWCYWKFVGFIIAKNRREKSGFHQLAYPRKKTLIDQVYSTIPSQNIQVSAIVPIYSIYYELISIQNRQCHK